MKNLVRACCLVLAGPATAAEATSPLVSALGATRPVADVRMRFESVDQEPFAQDAVAATLRARLGFETGKAWGTALLVEGEATVPLVTDYNSTTNGNVLYPVVADPESREINRLQLTNTRIPGTTVTLGRQRIVLDDHRFVGNVGWRQNEQTFDALRIVNRSLERLTVDVSYVNRVNRVFGSEARPGANYGKFRGDTWLANLAWQGNWGRLAAFGYLVGFDSPPAAVADSTQTYGLRYTGERQVGKAKLDWVASWATQQDWRANPTGFSNDYYLAELNGSFREWSAGLGYEVLGGDGTKGFATPLATLHRFQGWADKFLSTPADGIRDLYASAGHQRKNLGFLDSLSVTAFWHRYRSERGSPGYGSEWDLQLQGRVRRVGGMLKYSSYNARAGGPAGLRDTDKLWAQIDFTW